MSMLMARNAQLRYYRRSECIAFRKVKEDFGGLSDMASGYPIEIERNNIRTSEALYQACRFPHIPEVQRLTIGQRSPMTATMKSKEHKESRRTDWNSVRVPIKKWCLRIKLYSSYSIN